MNKTVSKYILQIGLSLIIASFLGLAVALFIPVSAVYADLPERPEPTEGVTTEESDSGAQIKLVVNGDLGGGEWTAVEWQDPNTGDWYAVANDGWQGDLASDGIQYWWVGADIFGDGPFRWLVYSEKGGDLLYTSENFSMPSGGNQVVIVTVPVVTTE